MPNLDPALMPPRIARLPRNKVGYPIPWFVATQADGTRDFRIAGQEQHDLARAFRLCWVCGDRLGAFGAFVIGPMCAVNRVSAEPPSHRDCALYSAKTCPFLVTPNMRRREGGTPDEVVPAAGLTISRNPGVALVWLTRRWEYFRPGAGAAGWLTELGDPTETLWFCEGRPATRAEVMASVESGLPLLQAEADADPRPELARAALQRQYADAMRLVPADA